MTASEEPPSTRQADEEHPAHAAATALTTRASSEAAAAQVNGHHPSSELPARTRRVEPPPVRLTQTRFRTFQTIIDVPVFRWYLLSMVGNFSAMQMQMLARGFLTYELTGSFAALGTIELANTMPRLLFALGGGVVADRRNRRAITQIGQMVNAAVAVVLSASLLLGVLRFEYLVIATVLQGIVNSFALPARQAMIPEIVGTERLTNALALNVSLMSTLRLGAPALAGFLIAVVGAAWVFALMGVLYSISSLTLSRCRSTAVVAAGRVTGH